MRKSVLLLIFCLSFLGFTKEAKAIDPKAKALIMMTVYGTVGGSLLGTASMAFTENPKPRAIAVGASLGLYAGLIFGGYVVTTFYLKDSEFMNPTKTEGEQLPADADYYPETSPDNPYDEGFTEDGGGEDSFDGPPQLWANPGLNLGDLMTTADHVQMDNLGSKSFRPVIYVPLLFMTF